MSVEDYIECPTLVEPWNVRVTDWCSANATSEEGILSNRIKAVVFSTGQAQ